MSGIQCRSSFALIALLLVLSSSRVSNAQVVTPSPSWAYTHGFQYYPHIQTQNERINHRLAERKLSHLETKLGQEVERGDSAGVSRNLYRINEAKYRMEVDDWLIRKIYLQDPGCYPYRTDAQTAGFIAQATRPAVEPYYPQSLPGRVEVVPTISITIVNAESAGVDFAINGVDHQAAGGSRESLAVSPASTITFNGGGSIGQRRHSISPGLYEFRSTSEGWVLYKQP